jgi:hypothetical protein
MFRALALDRRRLAAEEMEEEDGAGETSRLCIVNRALM